MAAVRHCAYIDKIYILFIITEDHIGLFTPSFGEDDVMASAESASRRWDDRAWMFNNWMERNGKTLVYFLLTIAIGLQQFPATEPLVVGVWWITLVGAFAGTFPFYKADWKSLVAQIVSNALAITLQVYLIVFCWEWLVWVDNGLRGFRELFARLFTGGWYGHLLWGHLIWLYFTAYFLILCRKERVLFRPMVRSNFDTSVKAPYWWQKSRKTTKKRRIILA